MTNEEWKIAETQLSVPFGKAEFLIDGYDVSVVCTPTKNPLKYDLTVYIDGKFKLDWCTQDCEMRRRFCFKRKKSLLTAEEKRKLARQKKDIREEIKNRSTFYIYYPFWNSFRSMKSHFIKNNNSIELVSVENINY